MAPEKLHQHLRELGPQGAASFLHRHAGLLGQVAEVKALLGSERMPLIYEGKDELLGRTQSYGVHEKPGDYLESFEAFIRYRLNDSVALGVVLDHRLDEVLEALNDALWEAS